MRKAVLLLAAVMVLSPMAAAQEQTEQQTLGERISSFIMSTSSTGLELASNVVGMVSNGASTVGQGLGRVVPDVASGAMNATSGIGDAASNGVDRVADVVRGGPGNAPR